MKRHFHRYVFCGVLLVACFTLLFAMTSYSIQTKLGKYLEQSNSPSLQVIYDQSLKDYLAAEAASGSGSTSNTSSASFSPGLSESDSKEDYSAGGSGWIEVSKTGTYTVSLTGNLATAIANGRLRATVTASGSYRVRATSQGDSGSSTRTIQISSSGGLSGSYLNATYGNGDSGTVSFSSAQLSTGTVTSSSITVTVYTFAKARWAGGNWFSWKYANVDVAYSLSNVTISFGVNNLTATFASNNSSYGSVSATSVAMTSFTSTASSTATANEGYYFSGWSDGTATRAVTTGQLFTLSTAPSLTANFAAITLNNTTVTYNASAQGVTAGAVSGYTFAYTYSGTATDNTSYNSSTAPTKAGTYTAAATMTRTSTAQAVGSKSVTLTINKKQLTISWSNTSIPYRAAAQLPTATITNLSGSDTCALTITGAGTNAGSYTAEITAIGNINYSMPSNTTQAFTITKLTPVLSGISSTAITYGQSLSNSTVTGTAKRDFDNAVVAGTWAYTSPGTNPTYANNGTAYSITFTPTDTVNFVNNTSTCAITVNRRVITLTWTNPGYVYNKTPQLPSATAGNLVFSDTCLVTVIGEKTDAGTYTATASALSNPNYVLPAQNTTSFTIAPFTLELSWPNTTLVYNGQNQIPVAVATNLFSGDTCTVTVTGERSQAGTGYTATAFSISNNNYKLPAGVTKSWEILPKVLPASYWTATVSSSFIFNGTRFLPVPIVSDDALGLLVKDRDYMVSYNENYSCITGGTVTISGIGNYQSTTEKSFTITKASQSVAFLSIRHLNENIRLETIATTIADYEVTFIPNLGYQANFFMAYAYTTAVYPDGFVASADNPNTAQMAARRTLINVTSPGSSLRVDYISDELVQIGGVWYSLTTAKIFLTNTNDAVQYGLNTLSASPKENAVYNHTTFGTLHKPVDDGYFDDFGQEDPTPLQHKLFIKKNHTAAGSFATDTIITEYGSANLQLSAGLNSGKYDYTLTSSNPALLSISGAAGDQYRTGTILNAGTVTVTVSHPGFVNFGDYADAYVAMEDTVLINIRTAELIIRPSDKTIVYGSAVVYDKTNSFVFSGFRNGDTSAIILSVNSGYNASTMKDVGLYYLTASGARYDTSVTTYQNYYFVYPSNSGTLRVLPKALSVSLQDVQKVYGEPNPAITPVYSGFIEGENQYNAADFAAPSINYGGVTEFTNIGTYSISLSGGSARNYTISSVTSGTLTIVKAPVTITLAKKTVDYGAVSYFANTPVLFGVAGGTAPAGRYKVFYLHGENYVEDTPFANVGSYTVRIDYITNEEAQDNYRDTSLVFDGVIEILPIAPKFSLDPIVRVYDTQEYVIVPIPDYSVTEGVLNGSKPTGLLSYLYKYESGEYSSALPKNSGSYSVRMVYTHDPEATDIENYISGAYCEFENILTIEKAEVTFEITKAKAVYQSTDGETPDRLSANPAVPHGIGSEYTLNAEIYPYSLHYRYYVDGAWQEAAPFNAGSYRVEVTFQAQGGLNYKTTVDEFENAVEIDPTLPTLTLAPKTISYTGKRISQNPAAVTGIAGGTEPTGSFEYLFAPHGSDIGFFSKELSVVNVNPDGGGYDILVRFNATPGSNYNSTVQRFDSAIIVMPVSPSITLKAAASSFSGQAYDTSKINASATGVSGGIAPSGDLSYLFLISGEWVTTPPMEVGFYSVQVTFTPRVNTGGTYANYVAATATFANAIEIKKVNPIINVTALKQDYSGEGIGFPLQNIRVTGVSELYPPLGNLVIQYSQDNILWSDDAPVSSGTYNIRIAYLPGLNENYNELTKIFNGALVIYDIPPVFVDLVQETHIFSGQPVVTSFRPEIPGYSGKGSLRLDYYVNNTWKSTAPKDAGEYDVKIIFTRGAGDSYKSHTKIYTGALVIVPRELIITPEAGQTKAFDNIPPVDIKYTVEGLLDSDKLAGALSAGTSANVGSYQITLGDLRLDKPSDYLKNYTLLYTEGVVYTVTPAEVTLTFKKLTDSELVYRGDDKGKYVSVTAKCGIFEIETHYTITGDTVNVGAFRVTASISDTNYILPAADYEEYTITRATFGENDNFFVGMQYTYNGTGRNIAATLLIEGSSVTYSCGSDSSANPLVYTNAGVYEITATVSHPNYFNKVLQSTLTILKETPNVKVAPLTENYYYNDPLPTLTCNNSDGEIRLDADQILLPSVSSYRWTFTPRDTENYNTVHGVVSINVSKIQTSLVITGQTKQSTTDPSALTPILETVSGALPTSSEGSITLLYTDKDGNVYNELPSAAGTYTLTVTFSGDSNYTACSYSTIITVTEPASNKWVFVLLAVVGGIALISLMAGLLRRRRV